MLREKSCPFEVEWGKYLKGEEALNTISIIICATIFVAGAVSAFFLGRWYQREEYFGNAYCVVVKKDKKTDLVTGISIYYNEDIYNEEERLLLGEVEESDKNT